MSSEQGYNGWTNYETWCLKLWIDNEEGSYRYWKSAAQECWDEAKDTPSANARLTGREPFTHDERATFALADRLKSEFAESMPELDGFWADMLNAALSEVNWHEIAEHAIEDDVDKTDYDAEEAEEEADA